MFFWKKYQKYIPYIIVVCLLLVRIALINVNAAEWGDSYRILRASNYIQHLTYPTDEKRPPLFSGLLALRPVSIDGILWGRHMMLIISMGCAIIFYKWCQKLGLSRNYSLISLVFLLVNPTYLYWSLRIYADLFFSFLVLLSFYLLERMRNKEKRDLQLSAPKLVILGVICGLSILTRFEGYLLTASLGLGILLLAPGSLKQKIGAFLLSCLGTILVITPWLIYRNPLNSSYFEEPTGRKYDLQMLLTYVTTYLFVLGTIPAAAVMFSRLPKPKLHLPTVLLFFPHVVAFVALESLLILAWPAALPRLFIPIIPVLIVAFVKNLDRLFVPGVSKHAGFAALALTVMYVVLQHKLRLQFFGPQTYVFATVAVLSVISALALMVRNKSAFIVSAFISMVVLSVSTIYLQRNIYRTIKEVAVLASKVGTGKVIHNDTAGVVSWYLTDSEYKNLDNKKYLSQDYLQQNNVRYLIITNEFNPELEIDLKKRPYLELLKQSGIIRGGKMFYTWLVKVNV